jgi:hypothetical protein
MIAGLDDHRRQTAAIKPDKGAPPGLALATGAGGREDPSAQELYYGWAETGVNKVFRATR